MRATRSQSAFSRVLAVTLSAVGLVLVGGTPAQAILQNPGGPASSMHTGDTLDAGQALVSSNGEFQLEMRPDGDLVLTGLGQSFFSTDTHGHPGAYLVNQTDGNLVVRSATGKALWASAHRFTGLSSLTLLNTGELAQFDSHSVVRWRLRAPDVTVLASGRRLTSIGMGRVRFVSQALASFVGDRPSVALALQPDGNLVSLRAGVPTWSTGTSSADPGYALMQPDGNFVVYTGHGRALWSTGTYGHPGARLVLQATDDNVVVYSAANQPLWSIKTGRIG